MLNLRRAFDEGNVTELVQTNAPRIESHHVVVDFGSNIPGSMQGIVLLEMERRLRDLGLPVEVYKRTMADDSKLRRSMSKEQRESL